jgi:hypothetical protein
MNFNFTSRDYCMSHVKILSFDVLEKNQNSGDIADGAGVDFFVFWLCIKQMFNYSRVLDRSFKMLHKHSA